MAEALESMFRRGVISGKQMGKLAALKGTKPQNSKMAAFDGKSKDEGDRAEYGHESFSTDEINEKGVQDKGGKYGTPSKGGRAGPERAAAKTREIDDSSMQKPKFPAGDKVRAGKRGAGPVGMGGKSKALRSSGGAYGGPNSRANG